MSWFVTGAAGFIGSNLCAHLIKDGNRVVGFDNLSTGSRENIARIQEISGAFSFLEGDIRDFSGLTQAIKGAKSVVHLAAQVSVQKSFADVLSNNEVNVSGFLNVLTAAAAAGAHTFIYASSCAVYGDPQKLPVLESMNPSPLSPYAVSKLTNEFYAFSLDKSFPQMRLFGLRLFNIFGPWQDPRGDYAAVIPRWISGLLKGEKVIIFGDGSATRDFCYVGNVCHLIQKLGEEKKASSPHDVYNIGTGIATNLNELYKEIVDLLQRKTGTISNDQVTHLPWRAGDIIHSLANISKAREALRFSPKISLREGLKMLLQDQYEI